MPAPPVIEFPENLPVWDLSSNGFVIADFLVKNVKGLTFNIINGVIHVIHMNSHSEFVKWNYDTKELEVVHLPGSGWAPEFASKTGSILEPGAAITVRDMLTTDDYKYRAVETNEETM